MGLLATNSRRCKSTYSNVVNMPLKTHLTSWMPLKAIQHVGCLSRPNRIVASLSRPIRYVECPSRSIRHVGCF
uniref:Uncharacterized protein n=1 Tax=Acrobeloides nanus TaxID=290746 RepID=A0A914D9R4_9BILA